MYIREYIKEQEYVLRRFQELLDSQKKAFLAQLRGLSKLAAQYPLDRGAILNPPEV